MNKQTTSKKTIKNTNTKKKRDIINIILLIMLFVILCTGVYFACTLQKFKVLSIQVKGNERLDFKTIAQISGIKYEENLFLLSKREVVERLKNNPYIEDVTVVKKVPNSVFIQVKEKKVIGYISSEGNSYLIDSNGKIIDVVPVDKTRRNDSKIEKKGFDKENTSPLTEEQIQFINALSETSYYKKIREYNFEEDKTPLVVLESGIKIAFDMEQELNYQIQFLEEILKKAKGEGKRIKKVIFQKDKDSIVETE